MDVINRTTMGNHPLFQPVSNCGDFDAINSSNSRSKILLRNSLAGLNSTIADDSSGSITGVSSNSDLVMPVRDRLSPMGSGDGDSSAGSTARAISTAVGRLTVCSTGRIGSVRL